jgi:hypothetical protein
MTEPIKETEIYQPSMEISDRFTPRDTPPLDPSNTPIEEIIEEMDKEKQEVFIQHLLDAYEENTKDENA